MKYINKFASICFMAFLGMLVLTGCEGGELYKVGAPNWLSDATGGGEEEKGGDEEEELENMQDDVYDIGNANFTAGFFTLGKTYIVKAGTKWNAQFNLTVNPDNKYFKNCYVVINRAELGTDGLPVFTGGAEGNEIGVIRYDNDPTKNSEWNTNAANDINRSLVSANFTNSSGSDDVDESAKKFNGKVTLTVDRTGSGIIIKFSNGTMVKTYEQTTPFPASNSDVDLCFRIGVDGSYINMLQSNVEPIGGYTSAGDKKPLSMTVKNVPSSMSLGDDITKVMADAGVEAEITFEDDLKKTVQAADLIYQVLPDATTPGVKTLVIMYSKTLKGENTDKPIAYSQSLNVLTAIKSMEVTKLPTYYFTTTQVTSAMANRTLTVGGIEVTGTYADGTKAVVDPADLTYSVTTVPAKAGNYPLTITATNGVKVETTITVAEAPIATVALKPTSIGGFDLAFRGAFSDFYKADAGKTIHVKFTNYNNNTVDWYMNYVIELSNSDASVVYGWMRSDNFGWREWGDELAPSIRGTEAGRDFAKWIKAMEGAKCDAYVTNIGNGFVDVQIVMIGNDNKTYTQYFLNVKTDDVADTYFRLTIDHSKIEAE